MHYCFLNSGHASAHFLTSGQAVKAVYLLYKVYSQSYPRSECWLEAKFKTADVPHPTLYTAHTLPFAEHTSYFYSLDYHTPTATLYKYTLHNMHIYII